MSIQNGPLISVIVPVYHMEKYLDKCLESILRQTYGNYEVLMVWDGGTERERDMCRAWQQKDPRLRLIEIETADVSTARNTALDHVSGDIIVFLDSDDYVKADWMERTVAELEGCSCGIVQFEVMLTDETESYVSTVSFQPAYGVHTAKEMILDLAEGKLWPVICARAYRREVFEHIRFPEGEYWEDVGVAHELLYKAETIKYVQYAGYYYVRRADSTTQRSFLNGYHWRYIQYRKRYMFIREHYPEEIHMADKAMIGACMQYGIWCVSVHDTGAYKEMQAWAKEQHMRTDQCPLTWKIMFAVLLHAAGLYRLLAALWLKQYQHTHA